MPSIRDSKPSPFSYISALKQLRTPSVPTSEKLETCHQLLSLPPIPSPLSPLLSHALYTLTTTPDHHAEYYRLLRDILLRAQEQHEELDILPETIFSTCVKDIRSAEKDLVCGVLDCLPTLVESRHVRLPSIYASLIDACCACDRYEDTDMEQVTISLLHIYARQIATLEQRDQVPAALIVLPALLSHKRLIHVSERLLMVHVITQGNSHALPQITIFLKRSHKNLDKIVALLLRSAVRILKEQCDVAEDSAGRGVKRGFASHTRSVLMVFRCMLKGLCDDISHEDRLRALQHFFCTAERLDVYRVSYEDLLVSRSDEKKAKEGKNVSKGKPVLRGMIVRCFDALVISLAKGEQSNPVAVVDTCVSVVSFCLDLVDKRCAQLILACAEIQGEGGTAARRKAFLGLLSVYSRTRMTEVFFERFVRTGDGSVLYAYKDVLCDTLIRESFAQTLARLPRTAATTCVEVLSDGEPRDMECVAFIVSLIIETAGNEDRVDVMNIVFERLAQAFGRGTDQAQAYGKTFLLASLFFAACRVGDGTRYEMVDEVVKSELVHVSDAKAGGVDGIVKALLKEKRRGNMYMFCAARLMAAMAHYVAGGAGDVAGGVRICVKGVFELFCRSMPALESEQRSAPEFALFQVDIISVVRSVIDLVDMAYGNDLKGPKGLEEFVSFMMRRYREDGEMDDLLEVGCVRNVFKGAVESCMREVKQCGGTEGKRCEYNRALKLLQRLPREYVTGGDVAIGESLTDSAMSRVCECISDGTVEAEMRYPLALQAAKEDARSKVKSRMDRLFKLVLKHGRNCNGLLRYLVRNLKTRGWDALFVEDCIEKLVRLWTDGSLAKAAHFIRNVDEMLSDSCLSLDVESRLLGIVIETLDNVQGACSSALKSEKDGKETPHSVTLVANVMLIRRQFEDVQERADKMPEIADKCKLRCDSFLKCVSENALRVATSYIAQPHTHESKCGNGKSLLIALCGGKTPVHRLFLSRQASNFTLIRVVACSAHYLASKQPFVRTAGLQVLAAIASAENEENLTQLGKSVTCELAQQHDQLMYHRIGSTLDDHEFNELVTHCERARAKILAGSTILCGTGHHSEDGLVLVDDQGVFTSFKPAQKRRMHSGIRLDRTTSGQLVIALLNIAEELIAKLTQLHSLSPRIRDAHVMQLEKIRDIIWESVVFSVMSCEIALERSVPYRIGKSDVQSILQSLPNVLRHPSPTCDDATNRHAERVHESMVGICRSALHNYTTATRWPASALLTQTLRVSLGTVHPPVSEISKLYEYFGHLAKNGRVSREVLCSLLADGCEAMSGVDRSSVRRGVSAGLAEILRVLGDEGRKVLMGMNERSGGKEVLRQVWEVYVGEVKYQGK